jgi:hypothetical protein
MICHFPDMDHALKVESWSFPMHALAGGIREIERFQFHERAKTGYFLSNRKIPISYRVRTYFL